MCPSTLSEHVCGQGFIVAHMVSWSLCVSDCITHTMQTLDAIIYGLKEMWDRLLNNILTSSPLDDILVPKFDGIELNLLVLLSGLICEKIK